MMHGTWLWLRLASLPRVEDCLPHLDGVIVPLHTSRGPVHVGPTLRAWLREWTDAGKVWWAMDWLTGTGNAHVEDLCARSLDLGAAGLMLDAERPAGWRGRVRDARDYRDALAEHAGGLDLAVTDGAGISIGASVLGPLLAEVDGVRPIGVPQSYDPDGRYDPDYHQERVDRWRALGAQRVVVGLGLWLGGPDRHRTPEELRRHMAGVPADVDGVGGWYARASALDDHDDETADDLLPVLGSWPGRPRDAATRPTDPAPAEDRPTPVGAGPLERAVDELLGTAARLKPTHPEAAEEVARAAERIAE